MILVIGYGNTLCGDDGVGPYVVDWLACEEPREDVECLAAYQLMPELAEPISHADVVIFVDAAHGGTPGEIAWHELTPVASPYEDGPGAFTHHVKAAILLGGARLLYGKCPTAYLYTIAGKNFNLGDAFSTDVESALPSLLTQLKARIAQCMNSASLKQ